MNINISSKGLKNLEFLPIDKDFTFISGGKEYPTFKIVACILSPLITNNLKNDKSMNKFVLPFDDKYENFQVIMDIVYSHDYNINIDNCFYIFQVAKLFQNKDLENIANIQENSKITDKNCFNLLFKMIEFNFPEFGKVASFIAKNFDALVRQRIKKDKNKKNKSFLSDDLLQIPIKIFDAIFQTEDFRIREKTYNLLVSILNERPDFLKAFKDVIFRHSQELSSDELNDFVKYIDDGDYPIAGEIIRNAVMNSK